MRIRSMDFTSEMAGKSSVLDIRDSGEKLDDTAMYESRRYKGINQLVGHRTVEVTWILIVT